MVEDSVAHLEKRVRQYGIALVVLFAYLLITTSVVGAVTVITRGSLCTFRGDLSDRYESTYNYLYLRDEKGRLVYPNRLFGVPRATIVATNDAQRETLDSLRGLHC